MTEREIMALKELERVKVWRIQMQIFEWSWSGSPHRKKHIKFLLRELAFVTGHKMLAPTNHSIRAITRLGTAYKRTPANAHQRELQEG